jgi:plastocyanin
MKPVTVFLAILLLTLSCGCTDSPPAPAVTPVTSTATLQYVSASPVKTTPQPVIITPSRTTSVSDNTIIIQKNTFRPANITITAGSTVRWVNEDDHPHRIEFLDKKFSASTYLLGSSQSASQRFDHAGRYDFACMIHTEMQGSILVEP